MTARSIVHVEIPAHNRVSAADFYKIIFDWDFEHMGPPMNYTTFKAGNTGGGFADVSPPSPAGQILIFIDSNNIDADLKKIQKLGGTIVTEKSEVPGFGWFAVFTDPTGNQIALWTGDIVKS